jgi:hypothetical protein
VVFGALGNDLGTGSPAVGGGEPDQLSGVVVSNAVQRAVAPVDYNARATPQRYFVIGGSGGTQHTGRRHERDGGPNNPRLHGLPVFLLGQQAADVGIEGDEEEIAEHIEVGGDQPEVSVERCQVRGVEAVAGEVTGLISGDECLVG